MMDDCANWITLVLRAVVVTGMVEKTVDLGGMLKRMAVLFEMT